MKREEDISYIRWEEKNKPWLESYKQEFTIKYRGKTLFVEENSSQRQTKIWPTDRRTMTQQPNYNTWRMPNSQNKMNPWRNNEESERNYTNGRNSYSQQKSYYDAVNNNFRCIVRFEDMYTTYIGSQTYNSYTTQQRRQTNYFYTLIIQGMITGKKWTQILPTFYIWLRARKLKSTFLDVRHPPNNSR